MDEYSVYVKITLIQNTISDLETFQVADARVSLVVPNDKFYQCSVGKILPHFSSSNLDSSASL